MGENDYMKELAIDLHALDEEWALQPQLYMKYAELAAHAQSERDKLKEKLDVVKAEIDDRIRTNPIEFGAPEDKGGNPKITEAWISATIVLQPEYAEIVAEINRVNYDMNIFKSAVNAFEQRKKALENEVQLWLGNYWSAPNLPRDSIGGKKFLQIKAEMRDEKQMAQREKINRKRRG